MFRTWTTLGYSSPVIMKRDEQEWVIDQDDWGNVAKCTGICRKNGQASDLFMPGTANPVFACFFNTAPVTVNRYFWLPLLGLSGMVISISPISNAGCKYLVMKFLLSARFSLS